LFSTFTSSIASIITFEDSSSKFIAGTGTIHPTSSLALSDVHHIHGVSFNLLSVSRLTKSLNCIITFSPTSYVFRDLQTKRVIDGGMSVTDCITFSVLISILWALQLLFLSHHLFSGIFDKGMHL